MKRNGVKFPLIVAYNPVRGGTTTYSKELNDQWNNIEYVEDVLDATVYKNSNHFKKYFGEAATPWLERVNEIDDMVHIKSFIHVPQEK